MANTLGWNPNRLYQKNEIVYIPAIDNPSWENSPYSHLKFFAGSILKIKSQAEYSCIVYKGKNYFRYFLTHINKKEYQKYSKKFPDCFKRFESYETYVAICCYYLTYENYFECFIYPLTMLYNSVEEYEKYLMKIYRK